MNLINSWLRSTCRQLYFRLNAKQSAPNTWKSGRRSSVMSAAMQSNSDSDAEGSGSETVRERLLPGKRKSIDSGDRCSSGKKFRGAALYNSKFQSSWLKTWPFVQPVKNDPHVFYCTVCRKSVSCKHQGERDIVRHAETAQHRKNAKALESTSRIKFVSTTDPLKDKVSFRAFINI